MLRIKFIKKNLAMSILYLFYLVLNHRKQMDEIK